MTSRTSLVRAALVALAIPETIGGLWGVVAPRSWNDDFPIPGLGLVGKLGPYNEHLATDAAAGLLVLGIIAIFAAVVLERRLVQAAMIAWIVFGIAHFSVHLHERGTLDDVDVFLNLAIVGATIMGPALVLVLVGRMQTGPCKDQIESSTAGVRSR